jgi:putative transposase
MNDGPWISCLILWRREDHFDCSRLWTSSRESPWIEVNRSLTSESVVCVLGKLASSYGLPKAITVDNGPEFTSKVMAEWCETNKVQLQFIKPGKPIENAFIESFNARVRDE